MRLHQKWHVVGPFAKGGMSRLYAVEHVHTGRPAVLKFADHPHPDPHLGMAEIRRLALLDHRNVIEVFDFGRFGEVSLPGASKGDLWWIMPRLSELPEQWTWPALRGFLRDVLQGLSAVHGAGLLHLDLKPQNVLQDSSSYVLADFGISQRPTDLDERLLTWGSLPYMAPERFDLRSERLCPATDLYAVGCMAFAMTTGTPPYQTPDWTGAAEQHRTAPPRPWLPTFPVPLGFLAWVLRLLEKRPWDRFAHAQQALASLEALGEPPVGVRLAQPVAVACATTLAKTAPGVPVPVAELSGSGPPTMPLAERWQYHRRPCRLDVRSTALFGLLPIRFVGRQEACGQLWAVARQVHEEASPRTVVIEGPAGVGRSRLGHHFLKHLRSVHNALVLTVGPDDSDPDLRHRWLALPQDASDDRTRDAVQFRTGQPYTGSTSDPLEILRALCQRRLTVVWIDDLRLGHNRQRLRDLQSLSSGALLIVAAERTPSALETTSACDTRIALTPLTRATIRTAVADWIGLDPELVAHLIYDCENDLALITDCVAHAIDRDVLRSGRRGLVATERLSLPPSSALRWGSPPIAPSTEVLRAVLLLAAAGADVPLTEVQGRSPQQHIAAAFLKTAGMIDSVPTGYRWLSPIPRRRWLTDHPQFARQAYLDLIDDTKSKASNARLRMLGERSLQGARDYAYYAHEPIGQSRMAEAKDMLDLCESIFREHGLGEDDPSWGYVLLSRNYLGATHRSYQSCWAHSDQLVARASQYSDNKAWRLLLRRGFTRRFYLADIQLWPNKIGDTAQMLQRWIDEGDFTDGHGDEYLAWIALRRGDAQESLRRFDLSLQGDVHKDAITLRRASRGLALLLNRDPSTVTEMERHLAITKAFPSAEADLYGAYSDALRVAGRITEAQVAIQRALRAAAGGEARMDPGTQMRWALVLDAKGDPAQAKRVLETTIADLGDEGPGWRGSLTLHLARMQAQLSEPWIDGAKEAVQWLQQAGVCDWDQVQSCEALIAKDPHCNSVRSHLNYLLEALPPRSGP